MQISRHKYWSFLIQRIWGEVLCPYVLQAHQVILVKVALCTNMIGDTAF